MVLRHTDLFKKGNYPLYWNDFSLKYKLPPLLLSVSLFFISFLLSFFFFALSFLFLSQPALGLESSQELSECPTAESNLIVNILTCPCELKQVFVFFSLPYSEPVKMYVYTSHKYSFIVHMWHVCRYALATSTVIYLFKKIFFCVFLPLIHMHTHRHTYTAWGHRGGLLLAGHLLRMAADEKYSSVRVA